MITVCTPRLAVITLLAVLAAGCSREQQDWHSAESADTAEGYTHFLEQHPDSEMARQASARVAQLQEDRDWQRTDDLATVEATASSSCSIRGASGPRKRASASRASRWVLPRMRRGRGRWLPAAPACAPCRWPAVPRPQRPQR